MEGEETQFYSEQERHREIKDATSIDDLCDILESKSEIMGSKGDRHDARKLITLVRSIEGLIEVKLNKGLSAQEVLHQIVEKTGKGSVINHLTRSENLRETARKLFRELIELKQN
jgi:hypothetical protein